MITAADLASPATETSTLQDAIICIAQRAPVTPIALRRAIAAMLSDPRFTTDHLLIVADAIAEAAFEMAFEGEGARARVASARALADLLRSPGARP